jgi:serine/threonine-protein kinase
VAGTPASLAPEVLAGAEADERSDLFSLGVLLYEAVTGRPPFAGGDIGTVMHEVRHGEPVPARVLNPALSPALDAVIARALSKAPEARQASARELADALEQALSAPAWSPAWNMRRWVPLVRPRVAVLAVAAGVTGIGLALALRAGEPDFPGPRMPLAIVHGLPRTVNVPATSPRAAVAAAVTPAERARRPATARATGTIVIESNAGVEVLVDGQARGRTAADRPLAVRDLPAGWHEVTLRLGDRARTLSGQLREGQTLTLAYTFGPAVQAVAPRPAPAARPEPPVTSPRPAPATVATLREAGPARADDAARKPRPPAAAPPADSAIAPPSPPAPAAPAPAQPVAFGCLSVNAVPFAAVFVDGQHVGDTPRACVRVRAGTRQVVLESPQGRSPARTVVVTAEHTAANPLRLSYDFHARRFHGP